MKPYGVKRKDKGCCPGHDKFPKDSYNNKRSKKAHAKAKKKAHKRGRREQKRMTQDDMFGFPGTMW